MRMTWYWRPGTLALLLLVFSTVQCQHGHRRRIVLKRPGQVFDAEAPKRVVIESSLPHAHQRYLPSDEFDATSKTGQPKGKSYEFSYAVKDGDHGDDFFHKERRQGKVTVGEYSVLLPDGRTQIVKYTSDAKDGYKADVTYEGEPTLDTNVQKVSGPQYEPIQIPHQQPPASQPYKHVTPAPANYPLPTTASASATGSPIYFSLPLKARRPSLSPSVLYSTLAETNGFKPVAATPTHKSALYSKHALFIPNPTYPSKPAPKKATAYPRPSPTAYAVAAVPSPTTYFRPTQEYRAVLQKVATPTSPYKLQQQASAPVASPNYASHIRPVPVEYEVHKVASSIHQHKSKAASSSSAVTAAVGPTSKSKLIPIEFFKAGPATKRPPSVVNHHQHESSSTRTVFSPKSGRFYSVAASPQPQEDSTITILKAKAPEPKYTFEVIPKPALKVVHSGSSGNYSPYKSGAAATVAPSAVQPWHPVPVQSVGHVPYRPVAPSSNPYFVGPSPITAAHPGVIKVNLQPRGYVVAGAESRDFAQTLEQLALRRTLAAQNQLQREISAKSLGAKYGTVAPSGIVHTTPATVHHYKPNQPDFGGKVAY